MAAIHFCHVVDFMIMMPLGPQLMRLFSISPQKFGFLVSSYTFSAGISGLLCSLFLDRFDRKKALLFFFVSFAIGTIACAVSRSYPLLLLSRSLTGFFGGVLTSIILSVVGDAISIERRGTAFGIVMGAFSIASIFGVPFSLYLANTYDWHAPFMFLGVTSLFIALLVSIWMSPMSAHLKGPHSGNSDPLLAIRHLLKSPHQLRALGFMACLVFGQFSIIPFLSPSFVSNAGLPEGELPLVYLCGGVVAIFASPGFGRLADVFGKRKIFYFGSLASVPLMLLITMLGPTPRALLLTLSGGFFLVLSGRMVPAMAMVSATASPRFRGSFMSIVASVQQFSSALAAGYAGLIVTRDATGRLQNYSTIGWNAALFTGLAIWMASLTEFEEKPPIS